MNKHPELSNMEDIILDIQAGGDLDKNISKLKKSINGFNKHNECMDILVTDSDMNNRFFGMRVFPYHPIKLLQAFERGKKHYLFDTYVLEIDGRLLFDKSIKATPAEIVAVILHEIGHIVNTDKVYQEFRFAVAHSIVFKSYKLHSFIKLIKFGSIPTFILELILCHVVSSFSLKLINTKSEKDADLFVINNGYASELNGMLTKTMMITNRTKYNKSMNDYRKENVSFINALFQDFDPMTARLSQVRDIIEIQKGMTHKNSKYFSNLVKTYENKLDEVDTKVKERKIESLNERANTIIQDEMLTELFNWFKGAMSKSITMKDVDELKIELDCIEDGNDKLYLLELIQKKKEKIAMAISYLEKNPSNPKGYMYPPTNVMKEYLVELDKIHKQVVNTRVVEKEYGVYVKYPKGYEG